MSSATIELYNALVSAGVAKEEAEAAAKAVISRQEALETLVTKAELYKALTVQAGFIIAAIGLMLTLS